MSIRITGDLAKVQHALATLPERMRDYAFEVLMDQAHLMANLAKVYAPVDTGSLRDSIRVERGGSGLRWRQVSVRAGGYMTNPRTGHLVDYAAIVEQRQPYMRPAYEEVLPTIRTMIQSRVVDAVNE